MKKLLLAIAVLLSISYKANAQNAQEDVIQAAYIVGYMQGYQTALANMALLSYRSNYAYNGIQRQLAYQNWLNQNRTMLAVLAWHKQAKRHQIQVPLVLPQQKKK